MASTGLTAPEPAAVDKGAEHRQALLEWAAGDGLTQEAIEALVTSAGWQRWLRVRCHLGGLHVWNQALVAHQRPGARTLAGPRGWRALGHEVRSDENAIRVWARVSASQSEDGPQSKLRLVPVFDQDQVRPIAELSEAMAGKSTPIPAEANLIGSLGQLIKFASEIGAPVTFEPIDSVVRSYHEPGTGAIVIDASPDHPLAARAYRLTYELASVLIDDDPRRSRLRFSETERVLATRSVSYCACAFTRSDLDRKSISVPAVWDREGPLAMRYAALVDRVTHRLEAALRSGPGERSR